MEIEQLVGFVRLQRAKLAGYECLDEVLTIVQDSDTKVKELQRLQRVEQAALDALKGRNAQADHELKHIRASHDAMLVTQQEKALKWHEAFTQESAQKEKTFATHKANLEAEYASLVKRRNDMLVELQNFTAQRVAEEKALVDAKAKLAAFVASIGA